MTQQRDVWSEGNVVLKDFNAARRKVFARRQVFVWCKSRSISCSTCGAVLGLGVYVASYSAFTGVADIIPCTTTCWWLPERPGREQIRNRGTASSYAAANCSLSHEPSPPDIASCTRSKQMENLRRVFASVRNIRKPTNGKCASLKNSILL